MKKYDFLNKNKNKLSEFIRAGIVDSSVIRNMKIYEFVENHKGLKMQAYTDASFKFNISEDRIRKIYKKMKSSN